VGLREIYMGLFSKSTPPPTPPDEPVWLVRRGVEDDPEVRVYQAVRGTRSWAEQHGIVPWDTLPGTEQAASDYMNHERKLVETIGITRDGKWLAFSHDGENVKWFLWCQQPPVPGVGGATEGESEQSPEGDGFSEGDRVRLAKPFWGELDSDTGALLKDWYGPDRGDPPTYPAGSQGTIIYPSPAPPEFVKEMKASGNYLVAMDDGRRLYAGGPFPGVEGAALERIPGRYQIVREGGQVHLRPMFNDSDRVRLTESFASQNSGKQYEAGWEGKIWAMAVTMAECWRTGYYPVSLDDDPFGGDRGVITVPAGALELVIP
jgi:hypothetical protein